MLELLSKIILIPIVLVILLVIVYVLSMSISVLWRIIIMFSSGDGLSAFPAGFLLILASIDTVNIGLILVGSFFVAGLIFVYLLDITEEDILGGFGLLRWRIR